MACAQPDIAARSTAPTSAVMAAAPEAKPARATQPVAPTQAPVEATPEQPHAPQAEPVASTAPVAAVAPSTPSTQAAPVSAARTGAITVELVGVESAEGRLLVALFRGARGFPERGSRAFAKRTAAARSGKVRVTFKDGPPGAFAVSAHHDADGDYAMDSGLFGMPLEGYGFSRDASAPFGPPDFADARMTLAAGEQKRVRIHLRY